MLQTYGFSAILGNKSLQNCKPIRKNNENDHWFLIGRYYRPPNLSHLTNLSYPPNMPGPSYLPYNFSNNYDVL